MGCKSYWIASKFNGRDGPARFPDGGERGPRNLISRPESLPAAGRTAFVQLAYKEPQVQSYYPSSLELTLAHISIV
jgi:hypothetical protein